MFGQYVMVAATVAALGGDVHIEQIVLGYPTKEQCDVAASASDPSGVSSRKVLFLGCMKQTDFIALTIKNSGPAIRLEVHLDDTTGRAWREIPHGYSSFEECQHNRNMSGTIVESECLTLDASVLRELGVKP